MATLIRKTFQSLIKTQINRRCLSDRSRNIYGGDTYFEEDPTLASGKTQVTFLNQEQEDMLFLDAYSSQGFKLNNGMRVMGPCAIFPRSVLHWNVRGIQDVNENSLSLFTLLRPKLDILVIGVGDRDSMKSVDFNIIKYLRTRRINVEILPTDQALSTFNFLNSERRYCAGAFIPPSYIEELGDAELYESSLSHGRDPMLAQTDYDHVDDKPGELNDLVGFDTSKELIDKSMAKIKDQYLRQGGDPDKLTNEKLVEIDEKQRVEKLARQLREERNKKKK